MERVSARESWERGGGERLVSVSQEIKADKKAVNVLCVHYAAL